MSSYICAPIETDDLVKPIIQAESKDVALPKSKSRLRVAYKDIKARRQARARAPKKVKKED